MESETLRLLYSFMTLSLILLGNTSADAQFFSPAIGQWEATASFRALDRPTLTDVNQPIFTAEGSGATLLDSNTATDLNVGLGPDISFVSQRENGLDYEIRFFFSNFNRNTLAQDDSIISPFFDGISFRQVEGTYQSDMVNIELNQKRLLNENIRLLLGIRYFHMEEKFAFDGQGFVNDPVFGSVAFNGNNTTTTKNPMLGYHIGAETKHTIVPGVDIGTYVKTGLFNNFASQLTTQTNSFFPVGTIMGGSENRLAFVSDFGVKFHFVIAEDFMSFFGGYDGMFVDGFAPAPANVNRVNSINNGYEFWVHGITFGFQVTR